MATLAAQESSVAGQAVTFVAAAAGGDDFVNSGQEVLLVKNESASPITVTIDSQRDCNQGVSHDGGGTVAAGATGAFGLFPRARFNDTNGKVQVGYSAVTSVTVAVVKANQDGI